MLSLHIETQTNHEGFYTNEDIANHLKTLFSIGLWENIKEFHVSSKNVFITVNQTMLNQTQQKWLKDQPNIKSCRVYQLQEEIKTDTLELLRDEMSNAAQETNGGDIEAGSSKAIEILVRLVTLLAEQQEEKAAQQMIDGILHLYFDATTANF